MIRDAKECEALEIATLLSDLHVLSSMRDLRHDLNKSSAAIYGLIKSGQFVKVIDEGKIVGVFIGIVIESWFGPDKMASDLAWYVHPDHRGIQSVKLLKSFIKWAKDSGAKQVRPGVSTASKSAREIYQRLGFQDGGTAFYKTL